MHGIKNAREVGVVYSVVKRFSAARSNSRVSSQLGRIRLVTSRFVEKFLTARSNSIGPLQFAAR